MHVMLKRDVADVQGMAIEQSLKHHGESVAAVKAGKYFEFEIEAPGEPAAEEKVKRLAKDVFSNPVIENSWYEIKAGSLTTG
jgi:phosphoribosylformylglycinamidine synthase PurS subunit